QDWTHEEKKGEQQRQQIEAGFRCRMQRAEFGADDQYVSDNQNQQKEQRRSAQQEPKGSSFAVV
ncbi:hypothetical protein HUU39_28365, partial [candidate division KSB1 bacterium]|nr:hypothetical protein [candidate division KSB1 bacterium]